MNKAPSFGGGDRIRMNPILRMIDSPLCACGQKSQCVESITLDLHPKVRLNWPKYYPYRSHSQACIHVSMPYFPMTNWSLRTGSTQKTFLIFKGLPCVYLFVVRWQWKIAQGCRKKCCHVGVGPIGLELLDTLMRSPFQNRLRCCTKGLSNILRIWAVRGGTAARIFEHDTRIRIWFNDEIVDKRHSRGIGSLKSRHVTVW